MSKHEVEYKGEKYEFSEEQYEELKSAIELIEKANRTKFSEINSDDLVDIKSVNMDQDLSKLENVVKYINEVKNARSIFDYLVLQSGSTIILENDSDTFHVSFEPCGEDSFCGTNPNQAVGLAIAESILEMTEGGDVFQTEYEPTGTTPDYAVGLQLSESEMLLENGNQETLFDYNMDNQTESGTFPNYAMAAQFADEVVDFAESSVETAFEYPVDNKFASEDV